jgi:terminal uridylyltransferase
MTNMPSNVGYSVDVDDASEAESSDSSIYSRLGSLSPDHPTWRELFEEHCNDPSNFAHSPSALVRAADNAVHSYSRQRYYCETPKVRLDSRPIEGMAAKAASIDKILNKELSALREESTRNRSRLQAVADQVSRELAVLDEVLDRAPRHARLPIASMVQALAEREYNALVRERVRETLEMRLQELFPAATVSTFGSTYTGLASLSSDIDMSVGGVVPCLAESNVVPLPLSPERAWLLEHAQLIVEAAAHNEVHTGVPHPSAVEMKPLSADTDYRHTPIQAQKRTMVRALARFYESYKDITATPLAPARIRCPLVILSVPKPRDPFRENTDYIMYNQFLERNAPLADHARLQLQQLRDGSPRQLLRALTLGRVSSLLADDPAYQAYVNTRFAMSKRRVLASETTEQQFHKALQRFRAAQDDPEALAQEEVSRLRFFTAQHLPFAADPEHRRLKLNADGSASAMRQPALHETACFQYTYPADQRADLQSTSALVDALTKAGKFEAVEALAPVLELEGLRLKSVKVLLKHLRRVAAAFPVRLAAAEDESVEELSGDISFNNTLGEFNSKLLRAYMNLDPRVAPLAMMLREWGKKHGLHGAKDARLSSYAFMLLTIFYLQSMPQPILPVLQRYSRVSPAPKHAFNGYVVAFYDQPDLVGCGLSNEATVTELFQGLMAFYADFDWNNQVVSVRLGRGISPVFKEKYHWQTRRFVEGDMSMWLEDPIDVKHNLFRQCNPRFFNHLLGAFKATAALYEPIVAEVKRRVLLRSLFFRHLPASPPRGEGWEDFIRSVSYAHAMDRFGEESAHAALMCWPAVTSLTPFDPERAGSRWALPVRMSSDAIEGPRPAAAEAAASDPAEEDADADAAADASADELPEQEPWFSSCSPAISKRGFALLEQEAVEVTLARLRARRQALKVPEGAYADLFAIHQAHAHANTRVHSNFNNHSSSHNNSNDHRRRRATSERPAAPERTATWERSGRPAPPAAPATRSSITADHSDDDAVYFARGGDSGPGSLSHPPPPRAPPRRQPQPQPRPPHFNGSDDAAADTQQPSQAPSAGLRAEPPQAEPLAKPSRIRRSSRDPPARSEASSQQPPASETATGSASDSGPTPDQLALQVLGLVNPTTTKAPMRDGSRMVFARPETGPSRAWAQKPHEEEPGAEFVKISKKKRQQRPAETAEDAVAAKDGAPRQMPNGSIQRRVSS